LKNYGYHLEHTFGHAKQDLAMLFAAMNLLAFAMHTGLRRPVDQSPPSQARAKALLRAHPHDHRLSGLPGLENPDRDADHLQAAPDVEKQI
jgi:hypothetical protein